MTRNSTSKRGHKLWLPTTNRSSVRSPKPLLHFVKKVLITLSLVSIATQPIFAKGSTSTKHSPLDIGFYLGGARLGSELYASDMSVLQPRALYRIKTEPSAGIFLRCKTNPWLSLEVSGAYSSLVGIGNTQDYSFKLNSYELCVGGVIDFISLMDGKKEPSRFQLNGKAGYGWANLYASSGQLLENNIPNKTIIPIGLEFAFAVDQKRNRSMIIGYDYRFTNYNNTETLQNSDREFEMEGYGIFKVGFCFKLGKNACQNGSCTWTGN